MPHSRRNRAEERSLASRARANPSRSMAAVGTRFGVRRVCPAQMAAGRIRPAASGQEPAPVTCVDHRLCLPSARRRGAEGEVLRELGVRLVPAHSPSGRLRGAPAARGYCAGLGRSWQATTSTQPSSSGGNRGANGLDGEIIGLKVYGYFLGTQLEWWADGPRSWAAFTAAVARLRGFLAAQFA